MKGCKSSILVPCRERCLKLIDGGVSGRARFLRLLRHPLEGSLKSGCPLQGAGHEQVPTCFFIVSCRVSVSFGWLCPATLIHG